MNHAQVTIENWRNIPEFVDWLGLEFSLDNVPEQVRQNLIHLLPLTVSQDRLIGAIQQIVLREALKRWNEPAQTHWFERLENLEKTHWRYLGWGAACPSNVLCLNLHGRLRRSLTPGQFCQSPEREVEKSP